MTRDTKKGGIAPATSLSFNGHETVSTEDSDVPSTSSQPTGNAPVHAHRTTTRLDAQALHSRLQSAAWTAFLMPRNVPGGGQ